MQLSEQKETDLEKRNVEQRGRDLDEKPEKPLEQSEVDAGKLCTKYIKFTEIFLILFGYSITISSAFYFLYLTYSYFKKGLYPNAPTDWPILQDISWTTTQQIGL